MERADYPKVFVTYYVKEPDIPQVSVPSRMFCYITGTGYCERKEKVFWTVKEARQWIAEHPEAKQPRICDHNNDDGKRTLKYTPRRRIRARNKYW